MENYRKILVAVDLNDDSTALVERARLLAASDDAIHLAFVFEPIDTLYYGMVPVAPAQSGVSQVEQEVHANVAKQLERLGVELSIPEDRRHMPTGSAAREIRHLAEEGGFDLIVMGAHAEKGVQRLLGSTANSVLHGAACDVLAMRLKD